MNQSFEIVGIRAQEVKQIKQRRRYLSGLPWPALLVLAIMILGCLAVPWLGVRDPAFMDMANYNRPPDMEFLFGTDTMGRDVFSCIWHGGRVSIFIGLAATVLSTFIAVVYGTLSGMAPVWLDDLLMRLTEILLSIPSLLLVILLLACMGKPNVFSIALVIGLTSWLAIAKVVRTEVRQLAEADFIAAARIMGGGTFYILRKHLLPNFLASIMFMVVMNVRSAIVYESTLSFMGLGLPLSVISWGSMLSLSEKALLTDAWWIILIPGVFLAALLLSLTSIGNYLRKEVNRKESNL